MPREAQRVVFDCVACAQAIINPNGPAGKCLELARDGALHLCISEYFLTEIRELPDKLAPRLRITPQKVEQFILDLLTFSRRVTQIPEVYVLERDPDDSHYINLAIAVGAKLITTRDRDLLDLMDDHREEAVDFIRRFTEIRIITPEALLKQIAVG